MTQEILQALRNIEDKIMAAPRPCTCHPDDNPPRPCAQRYALSECRAAVTPTAFNWTPSMDAIWPKDMRPTMSGLLAIWAAMRDAAVYDTSVPKPLAEDGMSYDSGWINWSGGIPSKDLVSRIAAVRLRDGSITAANAIWRWEHIGSDSDVVAYLRF